MGSARELARLSQEHDAYRWICGGIELSYRTLAKWRVQHDEALDELLTDTLASVGVVKLARVEQDGMRVRASARAASLVRKRRGGQVGRHDVIDVVAPRLGQVLKYFSSRSIDDRTVSSYHYIM